MMSEHFRVIQEKEGEFFGPRQTLIHGVRLTINAPSIDKDIERDLTRFETRSDDIFVVSFPKSGKAIDRSFRLATLLLFVTFLSQCSLLSADLFVNRENFGKKKMQFCP